MGYLYDYGVLSLRVGVNDFFFGFKYEKRMNICMYLCIYNRIVYIIYGIMWGF